MKFFISFCIILFCSFTTLKQTQAKQSYHILNEFDYSVLMYDMKNSLILNLLNQKSSMPDQAGQIDLLRKERPEDVFLAELKSSYIFSQLNLEKIKAQTIHSLIQNNISLLNGKFSNVLLNNSLSYYLNELEEFIKKPPTNIDTNTVTTAHVLFNPQIDPRIIEDAKKSTLSAINIAITRLDKKQWHKKMIICMNNNENHILIEKLNICTTPYNQAVIRELQNVLYDLKPYIHLFQKMQPMPPANQMQKVIYNNTYTWEKK